MPLNCRISGSGFRIQGSVCKCLRREQVVRVHLGLCCCVLGTALCQRTTQPHAPSRTSGRCPGSTCTRPAEAAGCPRGSRNLYIPKDARLPSIAGTLWAGCRLRTFTHIVLYLPWDFPRQYRSKVSCFFTLKHQHILTLLRKRRDPNAPSLNHM